MVFPKLRQACGGASAPAAAARAPSSTIISRGTGDNGGPHAAGPPAAVVGGKFVSLSDEQSKDLAFPVGCPVWYNFTRSPGDARVDVHEGVVAQVELDIFSKTLAFTCRRGASGDVGPSVLTTVLENDIAYAAGCPVMVLSSAGEGGAGEKQEGEILYATPVRSETGTEMSYIVRINGGTGATGGLRIEEGVKADRLKYRETRAQSKLEPLGLRNGVISPIASDEEPTEPSEVSVDSKQCERDQKKPNPPTNDTRCAPKTKYGYAKQVGNTHDHYGPDKLPSRHYQRRHDYSSSRRDREGKRSYDGYSGYSSGVRLESSRRSRSASDRSRETTSRRARDEDFVRSDAARKAYKRKSEETEKPREEKRIKWEPPHSWHHENDGAI